MNPADSASQAVIASKHPVQLADVPTSSMKSFAAVVARPSCVPRFPEVHLAARQYGVKDGVPSISFTAAEYRAVAQRFAHTLIAKFQVGRPPFEVVKQTMLGAWKIEGRVTISSNWDDRHVVIILDSEKDVNSVLTNPLRRVGHTMFRLFRWSAEYNPKKESTTVTKWIRFPGLPMEMFDRAILRSIVSSFGLFLDCDSRTKELDALTYARACVELDVTKPIPSSVWINLPDNKGFFQDIIIEGGLLYCSKCKIHGHDVATCRKFIREASKKMQNGSNQAVKEQGVVIKEAQNASMEDTVTSKAGIAPKNPSPSKKDPGSQLEQEWQVVTRKKKKALMQKVIQGDGVLTKDSQVDQHRDISDQGGNQDVAAGNIRQEVENTTVEETGNRKSEETVQDRTTQIDGVIEKEEGEIIVASNDDGSNAEGIDGSASTEEHAEDMQSSEVQIPEEFAQKISSYSGALFYSAELGGNVDARTFYMHFRTGEDDDIIFEELDNIIRKVQQEGSGISIEESDKVLTDHEVSDKESCDQVPSLMPILQTTRNRKKKGSRSSARSCAKQKDTNFVYS